ncbi:hypothetical protein BSNK01_16150 [Bacillaceae bacterium]
MDLGFRSLGDGRSERSRHAPKGGMASPFGAVSLKRRMKGGGNVMSGCRVLRVLHRRDKSPGGRFLSREESTVWAFSLSPVLDKGDGGEPK